MPNTPSSGTDLVALGVSVDTVPLLQATEAVTEMGGAFVKAIDGITSFEGATKKSTESTGQMTGVTVTAVRSLDDLTTSTSNNSKARVKATDVMNTANATIKNKIQLLQEEWHAEQALLKLEAEATVIDQRNTEAKSNLIVKLEQMVATYGMTSEALLRYQATQLGVSAQAEPLIAQLEALNAATKQYGVTITSVGEIEAARIQFEQSALTAFNAFKIRTMNENRAAAIADIEELEVARIAALEREKLRQTVFEAFKRRTMNENRIEAMRILTEQEATAAALAEKQAIEEIRWASMSVKGRILELEKLKAYQANSAISAPTIEKTFSSAAIADVGNLAKYQKEYADAIEATTKAHSNGHAVANNMADALGNISLQSSRARSEVIVLGHEMLQGRFSRMPASMMVLAEYTNAASLAFTGMGIAALASVVGVVTVAYEMAKGTMELTAFNRNMALTGGYAGQTRDSMVSLAQVLKTDAHEAIGTTTEMLMELVKSGKFSADMLHDVTQTALQFQVLSGQSTAQVASFFEGMVKAHGKVFNEMTNHTADWAAKANESYHFLTAAQYEHIRVLALEGRQEEAQLEIMTRMRENFARHDEQIGILVASYRGWVFMLQGAAHWLQELGKDWFNGASKAEEIESATKKLENLIKLKLQAAKGGSLTPGGQVLQANPVEVEMYGKAVRAQLEKLRKLQADYDHEASETRRQADEKKVDELGVFGQREIDSIRNANRSKDDIQKDYIDRFMQGVAMSNRSKIQEWEKSYKGDKDNMDAAMGLAIKNGTLKIETEATVAAEIERIKAKHHNRVAQMENDGYNVRRGDDLHQADEDFKLAKEAVERNENLLKSALKSHQISEDTAYALMKSNREDELNSLKEWARKRKEILDGYKPKTTVDKSTKNRLEHETNSTFDNVSGDITSAMGKNEEDRIAKDLIAYDKLTAAVEKANNRELENLDRAIAKQREHNAEIGKTKEQVELARKAQEDAAAVFNAAEADAIRSVLATDDIRGSMTEREIEQYRVRLAYLDQMVSKHNELAGLHTAGATAESTSPETLGKAASMASQQWKTAGEVIGKALTDGFGKGGKAAGDMFKAFAVGHSNQIKLEQQLLKAKADAVGLDDERNIIAQATDKYNAESARNRMDEYGNMASAAAGFFDEQSTGYKALMAVSKVFHAAELAMSIAELVPKAIGAVLNQGNGDPYTAFGRMAAMAAAVAGLGVVVGSFGGGSAPSTQGAKTVQSNQGVGTVFGDDKAKSDSIIKSMELVSKNSDLMLPLTSQMALSLRNIDSSMKGLTNLIVRTVGITDGSNFNVSTGTTHSGVAQAAGILDWGIGGAMIGSVLGPLGTVLGGMLGSILGNTVGKLWGKTSTNVTDSGLQFGGAVGNLQRGYGINQYANVHTDSSSWFGLSHSSSDQQLTQGTTDEISQQFALVFNNLESVLTAAGVALGKKSDVISDAVKNFVLDTTKISFSGLKGQDLQDAVNNVLSGTADKITTSIFPEFEAFRQLGEGYTQTIVRVASGIETAQIALKRFGIEAIQYTDILNKQGDVAAEVIRQSILATETSGVGLIIQALSGTSDEMLVTYKSLLEIRKLLKDVGDSSNGLGIDMIQGAGGLSELKSGLSAYFSDFFSKSEQAEMKTRDMADQLRALGVEMPASKDGFRDLVEGIDQTTAAGHQLYGALVALTPQMSDVVFATDKLANAQTVYNEAVNAANSAMQTAATQYQSFVDNVASAQTSLNSAKDAIVSKYKEALDAQTAADKAVADARASITASYVSASEKLLQIQNKVNDSLIKMSTNLKTFLGTLDSTDLGGGSKVDQYAALQTQFAIAAAQAKSGDTDAGGKLSNIATSMLKLQEDIAPTKVDYAREVSRIRQTIGDVVTYTDAKTAASPGNSVDEMAKAQVEVAKWAAAATASGASIVASSTNVLDAYNKALSNQSDASNAVQYWASVANSVGVTVQDANDAIHKLGADLVTNFYAAQQELVKTQLELTAAKIIKGDLDLKQTTALQTFTDSIKDVNITADAAMKAATALFNAASDDLVKGTEDAKNALVDAKSGMEFWAKIVTDTADNIAKSVAAMSGAASGIAAQQELVKTQLELTAAKIIKGDLDLKQTTALQTFTDSIKDVNITADAAMKAATALFNAASDDLVKGTEDAKNALVDAKSGMEFWAKIVTDTADNIAKSVAAMSGAASGIAASIAAQSITSTISSEYQQLLGRAPEQGGLDFWTKAMNNGMTASQLHDAIISSSEYQSKNFVGPPEPADTWYSQKVSHFAAGGDFSGGLRMVGETGIELESTGPSRIWNAGQTQTMLSNILRGDSSQGDPALLQEMRAMRNEITELRKEQRIGDSANVVATNSVTRLLRDVTDNGTAVVTTAAA